MSSFDVPILFLVFNRPDVTKKVFEQIKKAKPKKLYIAADGPRKNIPNEKEICNEVIKFVTKINWNCEVKTLFREENLGCGKAVSSAIDWFFENEEFGIILEDDCVPDQSFFGFCEQMLVKYKDDARIMMVAGTNYLLDSKNIKEDYFFSQFFIIWGWATWRRAWQKYDFKMSEWSKFKRENRLEYLTKNYFIKKYFEKKFDLILNKRIDTWDIQWVFTCLFNNGLCITPKKNLISNLGTVGAHVDERSGGSNFLKTFSLNLSDLKEPKFVFVEKNYDMVFHKTLYFSTVFGIIKDSFIFLLKMFHVYAGVYFFYKLFRGRK